MTTHALTRPSVAEERRRSAEQARQKVTLACDRCNHDTDLSWLSHDGIGLVCPPCRIGGALARGEVIR